MASNLAIFSANQRIHVPLYFEREGHNELKFFPKFTLIRMEHFLSTKNKTNAQFILALVKIPNSTHLLFI